VIIPLPRGFRQKSNAFYAKTKVATGGKGESESGCGESVRYERDVGGERKKKARGGGKIVEAEERKRRMRRGREREAAKRERERERKVRRRTEPSTELTTTPSSPSSSIEDTLRLSVPSYVLALARRPPSYSHTVRALTQTGACTESRSHPPAARGPARPTPPRRPSFGRRVPALSVFPRPVPTTPFHAVSRRACPYTPPASNCPLYRL